jgi:hypothetical protein
VRVRLYGRYSPGGKKLDAQIQVGEDNPFQLRAKDRVTLHRDLNQPDEAVIYIDREDRLLIARSPELRK